MGLSAHRVPAHHPFPGGLGGVSGHASQKADRRDEPMCSPLHKRIGKSWRPAVSFIYIDCRKGAGAIMTAIHVLIAGSGPAGVEAALALQRIAAGRVATTIVAPDERMVTLPPAVLSPFAAGEHELLALDRLVGAQRRRDTIVSVDRAAREVRLSGGEVLTYD